MRASHIGWLCVLTLALCPNAVRAGAQLPTKPSELLLVGDSVTAGIYYLSLSDESIRQSWSRQLMRHLGFDAEWERFAKPYPIDHLGLTRRGYGGLAYPWNALRAILPRSPVFDLNDERVVMAIPGQMAHEVLEQSSKSRGDKSSGWTFAAQLLPKNLSSIDTIKRWQKRPSWVVLFIGANDLLASFGIVGNASPPSQEEFANTYRTLVGELRSVMHRDASSRQLLVLTLPDVTRLPMLQPLPKNATDEKGQRYPAGSKASAFLVPFRKKFEQNEVWTPAELAVIRERVDHYNDGIERIAKQQNLTVVDMGTIMNNLSRDPSFALPTSPYFSPDLHHPSYQTHRVIADAVITSMADVAGTSAPPEPKALASPLPTNEDFTIRERKRVNAMMRMGIQGLKSGPLPPAPDYRFAIEAGGQAGDERVGSGAFSILFGIESVPSPITLRWLSRAGVHARISGFIIDTNGTGDVDYFKAEASDVRISFAFERIGAWDWGRIELGPLIGFRGGGGWYTRGEWRFIFAEVSARGVQPDRIDLGLRLGWLPGRPGRNGN